MGHHKFCSRCGQDLRLAECHWHYHQGITGKKGELCGRCVTALSDEERGYWE